MKPLGRASSLTARLAAVQHPLFLLDLDGTLAPIVDRPARARVPATTRRLLHRLRATGACVVIVSGRSIPGVREALGMPVDAIIGDHGAEAQIGGRRLHWLQAPRAPLARAGTALAARIHGVAGLRLERKRHSVALHLRGPLPRQAALTRELAAMMRGAGLRVLLGHRVLDGQLPGVDKGRAVARWLRRSPAELTLYAGDDTTDEDAFRQLRRQPGESITIAVGGRPRLAEFRTTSPVTFRRWLERIVRAREAR
jgi:trehalose 6-phosphate phosphatase